MKPGAGAEAGDGAGGEGVKVRLKLRVEVRGSEEDVAIPVDGELFSSFFICRWIFIAPAGGEGIEGVWKLQAKFHDLYFFLIKHCFYMACN